MDDRMTAFTLDRPGCRLHCWLAGPEGAPLVALVHGAACDHRLFDPQVPAVAESYRVVTLDVRGHGLSRPCATFSLPEAAEDLAALFAHLGYERAVVIGQSMGGNIAQELAFLHPERVRALVLIGSTCNTWKLSPLETLSLRLSGRLLALWPYAFLRRAMAWACGLRPETQAYVLEATGQLTKEEFLRVWAGVARALHCEPQYRIAQPLLLTHGARDTTGNIRRIAPLWAEREVDCRYAVIPEAAHVANYDNPEFFNRVLLDFLAGLGPETLEKGSGEETD